MRWATQLEKRIVWGGGDVEPDTEGGFEVAQDNFKLPEDKFFTAVLEVSRAKSGLFVFYQINFVHAGRAWWRVQL